MEPAVLDCQVPQAIPTDRTRQTPHPKLPKLHVFRKTQGQKRTSKIEEKFRSASFVASEDLTEVCNFKLLVGTSRGTLWCLVGTSVKQGSSRPAVLCNPLDQACPV
eukprot:6156938-Amphidinium_carterae.1